MEQLAAQAERASIKYKMVEFMSERIGNEYEGVISGVTEWGIYVEIEENKCEGMIPLRELDDDYYEFDESAFKDGRVKFTKLVEQIKVESLTERCIVVFDKIDRLTRESSQSVVADPSRLRRLSRGHEHRTYY